MPDSGIRASDQERERTAAALGGHYADGRLTLEEFQERLGQAYAAKTLGELDDLMTDLPETDLSPLPAGRAGSPGRYPPLPGRRTPGTVQAPGSQSVAGFPIALAVLMIWLISGTGGTAWLLCAEVLLVTLMMRGRIARESRPPGGHRDHQPRP